MKKRLLTLAVVAAISVTAFAQNTGNATNRKVVRETRAQQMTQALKADLSKRSFIFYPNSYTLPFQSPTDLYNFGYYYLDIYPTSLDIFLPFAVNADPATQFSSTIVPYTLYKVVSANDNNYIVTARVTDVSNSLPGFNLDLQGLNIGMHLSVNVMSGAATLTLTPDFSPAVSYQGVVRQNT